MELALIIYFAGVVGNISNMFVAFGCMLLFVAAVWVIAELHHAEFQRKYLVKPAILFLTAFFSFTTSALLPSEKTVYLMTGAYATQEVFQSNVGQKTLKLIKQKLDEELNKDVATQKETK